MNEQPNKGGRPPIDGQPAIGKITWRVTMERKNRCTHAAQAMGLSLCGWLTRLVDKATGHEADERDTKEPPK